MIQKVRHHHEEARMAPLEAVVGDGRGEVRLPAPKITQEDEPPLRIFGELSGPAVGLSEAPFFVGTEPVQTEVAEGHAGEQTQVAGLSQILETLVRDLVKLALAGDGPTEVRVIRLHVPPHVPGTVADRADFGRLSA
jgi:hypothetical protein